MITPQDAIAARRRTIIANHNLHSLHLLPRDAELRAFFAAADLVEVERIRQTEVPEGVPMAQWALAWCLKNLAVSTVIPGCMNPTQVAANAAAAELEIG